MWITAYIGNESGNIPLDYNVLRHEKRGKERFKKW